MPENNRHYGKLDNLRGAFQPIADMWKDVKDTFKPYKSSLHIKRDAMQPLRGLGNVGVAALSLVGGTIAFLVNTIRYAFSPSTFVANMKLNLARTGAWIMDSVTTAIRGSLQILTTPLTWFVRMPFRGIITAVKGMPKIENNKGMQRLVRKGYELTREERPSPGSMDLITRALHVKYKKALLRGQETTITLETEASGYHRDVRTRDGLFYTETYGSGYINSPMSADSIADARQYLGLFGTDTAPQQLPLAASSEKDALLPPAITLAS